MGARERRREGGTKQEGRVFMRKAGGGRGLIVVVSSPSGGGKTTICHALVDRLPGVVRSVSMTTRPMRPGEVDGRDYHFVSLEEFQARRSRGEFAEWAKVHGHYYGTPRAFLEETIGSGTDVLLSIDVQGGMKVKRAYPDALMVFIMPPSRHVLRQRLLGRRTDPPEVIAQRLSNAEAELGMAAEYEYVIVNRNLQQAVEQLEAVIRGARSKAKGFPKG